MARSVNTANNTIDSMASTSSEGIIRPSYIGHFGMRTTPEQLEKMIKWHCNFFGGTVALRSENAAFIRFDDEHHRLVIVADSQHKPLEHRPTAACIYHIAFTLNSLADLATSYEQKKAHGILPHWPVNHGISTSMYYHDPDGNEFEMQVDNFATAREAHDFMRSEEFKENPIGVDIVVDDFIKRVRSGEDEAGIKKRPRIGPRRGRWDNSIYFKVDQQFSAVGNAAPVTV